MSHQPTLLRGKDGSQSRGFLIDSDQGLRLFLYVAVQGRMGGYVFQIQRGSPDLLNQLG
ncbi:hypothetical protein [Mesorhizobium sp. WSM4305]|uniref:hypothetical protein n=1 Tax=Mesorhizobium sp. WSM4305 TaxID=2589886 RepID=UPI001FEE99E1|nr:hypothetical protein [Mesorhizobium sp. WSM4305]